MLARALILAVVLVGAGAIVQVAARREVDVPRSALSALPREIGGWQGSDAAPLADDVVATLGVDDYVNRRYARGGLPISVYIGYYGNQRSGDAIHSPQNCLPGSGWQPVSSGLARIDTRRRRGDRDALRDRQGHEPPGGPLLVSGPRPRGRGRVLRTKAGSCSTPREPAARTAGWSA